jgi:hypothetical protein
MAAWLVQNPTHATEMFQRKAKQHQIHRLIRLVVITHKPSLTLPLQLIKVYHLLIVRCLPQVRQ